MMVDFKLVFDVNWFKSNNVLTINAFYVMFYNEIFGREIWVVTSWYQSPGLRDSDTPSGVSELKSRD